MGNDPSVNSHRPVVNINSHKPAFFLVRLDFLLWASSSSEGPVSSSSSAVRLPIILTLFENDVIQKNSCTYRILILFICKWGYRLRGWNQMGAICQSPTHTADWLTWHGCKTYSVNPSKELFSLWKCCDRSQLNLMDELCICFTGNRANILTSFSSIRFWSQRDSLAAAKLLSSSPCQSALGSSASS